MILTYFWLEKERIFTSGFSAEGALPFASTCPKWNSVTHTHTHKKQKTTTTQQQLIMNMTILKRQDKDIWCVFHESVIFKTNKSI